MKAVLTLFFISLFGAIRGQDSLLRLKHKWVQDYMNETIFCYQEHSIDNDNSLAITPDSVCSLLLQDSLGSKYIYVSDKIEHFNNVIELEITGNGTVRISSRIGSLTKLRCLEIEGQIDDLSIPDSLRLCDNLEIIDFQAKRTRLQNYQGEYWR